MNAEQIIFPLQVVESSHAASVSARKEKMNDACEAAYDFTGPLIGGPLRARLNAITCLIELVAQEIDLGTVCGNLGQLPGNIDRLGAYRRTFFQSDLATRPIATYPSSSPGAYTVFRSDSVTTWTESLSGPARPTPLLASGFQVVVSSRFAFMRLRQHQLRHRIRSDVHECDLAE